MNSQQFAQVALEEYAQRLAITQEETDELMQLARAGWNNLQLAARHKLGIEDLKILPLTVDGLNKMPASGDMIHIELPGVVTVLARIDLTINTRGDVLFFGVNQWFYSSKHALVRTIDLNHAIVNGLEHKEGR